MTAHTANLVNAIVLITCSLWAYLTAADAYWTSLIPAGFGLALLACTPGVRAENKIIAHVAVTLTLVIFLMLFVPLFTAKEDTDMVSFVRVGLMMATCVLAKIAFIKSFRDARRARENAQT